MIYFRSKIIKNQKKFSTRLITRRRKKFNFFFEKNDFNWLIFLSVSWFASLLIYWKQTLFSQTFSKKRSYYLHSTLIFISQNVKLKFFLNEFNNIKKNENWVIYTQLKSQYNLKNIEFIVFFNAVVRIKKYDFENFVFKKL